MSFPVDLKTARKATGLSQEAAAAELTARGVEVALRTLAGWERGENAPDAIKAAAVLSTLQQVREERLRLAGVSPEPDSAPEPPPLEEALALLRSAFGDGAGVDVQVAESPRIFEPSPAYVPEVVMSRGEQKPVLQVIGRAVQDRRYYPEARGGFTHRMPTAAFQDVAAGSPLYSQPCAEFVGAGYYEVALDGEPMMVDLARVPGGGFRLRFDDKGPPEYVDPDDKSPTGWVDRGSGRPAAFEILALILTSHRVHAAPINRNGSHS